tara:strand:+ start:937 stop:2403 length:1467 start_codon:yes stop_codon:yes gene_type:complete
MFIFATMKNDLNIVWLKRDLRTLDHEPLHEAEKLKDNYIIIYLFEPNQMNYLDFSERHQHFIYRSIIDINKKLIKYRRKVYIFHANATDFFNFITEKYKIKNVLSYQESGTKNSWIRDINVEKIFKSKNVVWNQFQNQGVVRSLKNRKGWDKNWYRYANSPIIRNKFSINDFNLQKTQFDFCIEKFSFLKKYPEKFQPAGEIYANKYLISFLKNRAINYNYHISSPEKSRYSCSRLSPYLSWGNLSVRYVFQEVKNHYNFSKYKRSFSSFLSRLKWRSHFIQKFEVENSYEFRCVNLGYEKMNYINNSNLINSWKNGRTGFPLIDASMKCLIENGWINFRMRAMLVSFFCHYLEQNWKNCTYHLAKLFLDYEPGIHYTQIQMQAGVTGINSIRVYNPIKQSIEKDPKANFIKKWIPELSKINNEYIHRPWELTEIDLGDETIPEVYKNPVISTKLSKNGTIKSLWKFRSDKLVKNESKRLLNIHVRKK